MMLFFSGITSECVEQFSPVAIGALSAILGFKMGEKIVKGAEEAHVLYNIAFFANNMAKLPKEVFNKIVPGRHNEENISDIVSHCGDAVSSINSTISDIAHHRNTWIAYLCGILAGTAGWYFSSKILQLVQQLIAKKMHQE